MRGASHTAQDEADRALRAAEPLVDWRACALRLGWSERELATLESSMALPVDGETRYVVAVEPRVIVYVSRALRTFRGVNSRGEPTETATTTCELRRERRYTYEPSQVARTHERAPWCPCHQHACHPRAHPTEPWRSVCGITIRHGVECPCPDPDPPVDARGRRIIGAHAPPCPLARAPEDIAADEADAAAGKPRFGAPAPRRDERAARKKKADARSDNLAVQYRLDAPKT